MLVKKCFRCGVRKSITDYYFRKDRNNYTGVCRTCLTKACVESHRRHPETYRRINSKWSKSKKGKLYRRRYSLYYIKKQLKRFFPSLKKVPFKGGTVRRYGIDLAFLVYSRANFCCEICKSDNKLHIHHIDRNGRNNANKGLPVNNNPNNLQLLCIKCHGSIHGKQSSLSKRSNTKNVLAQNKRTPNPIPLPTSKGRKKADDKNCK